MFSIELGNSSPVPYLSPSSIQFERRVLRFALDLKDNLGPDVPRVEDIPKATIERAVVNNIYGGNILIASHAENTSQLSQTVVASGNWLQLTDALHSVGVSDIGIRELEGAIKDDEKDGTPSIGPKVKGWLRSIGNYLGKGAAGVGVEVAKSFAKKWVLQHYGIDIDL